MIKLSTNSRYGTRILVYLASMPKGHPARRQDISKAEGISLDYVEQILLKLRSAGFAKSVRGSKGGFLLKKDPGTITIADVIEATEGSFELAPCELENCSNTATCVTMPVWKKATEALRKVFKETTISDMANQLTDNSTAQSLMFNI